MRFSLDLVHQLTPDDREEKRAAALEASRKTCGTCSGSGCLDVPNHLDGSATTVDCRDCNGTGAVVDEELLDILLTDRSEP